MENIKALTFKYVLEYNEMLITPDNVQGVILLKEKKKEHYYFKGYKVDDLMLDDSDICYYMLSAVLKESKIRLEKIDFNSILKGLHFKFIEKSNDDNKIIVNRAIKHIVDRPDFEDIICNIDIVKELLPLVILHVNDILKIKKSFIEAYVVALETLSKEIETLSIDKSEYTLSKPLVGILLKNKNKRFSLNIENQLIHKLNKISKNL
ncbi:hypothetical protein ABD91_03145 [Lysinibacillus sphaericus]|uniref:hypothetical protein n=1 Tax=Lysinibacillus sphaericus TaxID=1421 RepID=UPI0018CCDC21|nr:hypothetical protein [Lysinibacillus sphaericus]MBG9689915.1 hypothetical protein [Lysinibacillus sphaericus]